MTTFTQAVQGQTARTENNMKALRSTQNPAVDLFYTIGSSRGKNIVPAFTAAYVDNPELAGRIALWARDARGGAGERQTFRNILTHVSDIDPGFAARLLNKVPELGRWDDLLVVKGDARHSALHLIGRGLMSEEFKSQRGLVAKWMPRKGPDAVELRKFLGLSPRDYRKMLVEMTRVVEQQMCAKDWDKIVYDHVPSVAAARYQKAFNKHDPTRYSEYRDGLKKGERKINASVVYPYDVIYSLRNGIADVAVAQWEALPNYVGSASTLPLVDVSGSMETASSPGSKISNMDVAVSLGLYLADKNRGAFKDTFLTFSGKPELLHLKGNLKQKMDQMMHSSWDMNTDLHKAMEKILDTAKRGAVPEEEMPQTLLILSDMQFDSCVKHDDSAIEMIRRKYNDAGYVAPRVVFWCLNAHYKNVPVKSNEQGVALVSGFSPAIMQSILGGEEFTPEAIMLKTVLSDRYNF